MNTYSKSSLFLTHIPLFLQFFYSPKLVKLRKSCDSRGCPERGQSGKIQTQFGGNKYGKCADAGLPELDRPYRVNAFAGMMAINVETERLQKEVLEQMNLTQNLRDDVRGLDQRMKQMVVEEQGRRVVVPAGEQFTLETIHDHFWMPVGTEGNPQGWEIDRVGKRAS